MNVAEQIVETLLENDPFPDSQMLGTKRERHLLDKIKQRRSTERQAMGVPRADSAKEWERIGHDFKHVIQTDPEVRRLHGLNRNVGEALGVAEGEMPDWLKKKISGKADDEGDDEGGEGDGADEGGESKSKSSGGSKASSNVAAACGPAPGKVKNSI